MPRKIARYGWKPQLPDHRDEKVEYAAPAAPVSLIDLRAGMPPVYNQLDLGSCGPNAFSACVDYERKRQGMDFMIPSRLWLYYAVRDLEGSPDQDSGIELRDAMKVLTKQGVPPESMWPYDITKFTEKPPQETYDEAVKHETLKYRSPYTDLPNLKAGLALGFPFAFGMSVYDSFESDATASTGIVTVPLASEASVGGHAIVACGYDDNKTDPKWSAPGAFLVRNSWGADWGDAGYFWLPYAYMANPDLVDDFWSIRLEG